MLYAMLYQFMCDLCWLGVIYIEYGIISLYIKNVAQLQSQSLDLPRLSKVDVPRVEVPRIPVRTCGGMQMPNDVMA